MTLQSLFEQHVVLRMHVEFKPHTRWPLGHAHVPPKPLHDSPETGQSLFVQHVPVGMQRLPATHTLLFAGQLHTPPMPEHDCPVTVQSLVVQHVPLLMHWLTPFTVQTCWPLGHTHEPPGFVQYSPMTELQSAVVQHV